MRAMFAANPERVQVYWDLSSGSIADRPYQEGWGTAVTPLQPRELRNERPELSSIE